MVLRPRQHAAVAKHHGSRHPVVVAFEDDQRPPRLAVPETCRMVLRPRQHATVVERLAACDSARVPCEHVQRRARFSVPDS